MGILKVWDTLTSFLQGMGIPGRDSLVSAFYVFNELPPEQLLAMYRGDWVSRKLVDIPPNDMTREWRNWQASNDQIELIEAEEKRLLVRKVIKDALIKARLYGGSVIYMGVDDDQSQPLNIELVKKGSLKFLRSFSCLEVGWGELELDLFSKWYGEPTWYQITQRKPGADSLLRIHPSRFIRLDGAKDTETINTGQPWGLSILQVASNAIKASGLVTTSIAQLISEAKTDIIKTPDLAIAFSTEEGMKNMQRRYSLSASSRSNLNTLLLDTSEEWQRQTISFSGMPDVLQMYLLICCAAADIPATRFLGRSPAGLNSTGDSDLLNYYDRLKSDQSDLSIGVLDEVIIRSALGERDPSIYYEWAPLWQMTTKEKAEIAEHKARVVDIDRACGLIPLSVLAKGRQNQLIEDGFYPGLENALEEADDQADFSEEEPNEEGGRYKLPFEVGTYISMGGPKRGDKLRI